MHCIKYFNSSFIIFSFLSSFKQGIVKALQLFQQQLIEHKVSIFVRRGGPNYQEGLRIMRELGTLLLYQLSFLHYFRFGHFRFDHSFCHRPTKTNSTFLFLN